MPSLQNEIGNKQSLQTEGYFAENITTTLANLIVVKYVDCIVFSVYQTQSKTLLAYAIYSTINYQNENGWLHLNFNQIFHVSLSTNYEVLPFIFNENNNQKKLKNTVCDIQLNENNDSHILDAIFQYHQLNNFNTAIYLYENNGIYNVSLFKNNQLMFSNAYHCTDENEVLYYIANALQVNEIEKETVYLYYDYSIATNNNLLFFLQPFFTTINALKHPSVNDDNLPFLAEKLFIGYAIALCE